MFWTKTVNSLCKVLGVDFKKAVTKIHHSLGNDSEGMKSLTNKTIMGLASSIQRLQDMKMKRMQRFKKKNQGCNHHPDPLALSQGIFLLYESSKGCYGFSMYLETMSCSKRVRKTKNDSKRKKSNST